MTNLAPLRKIQCAGCAAPISLYGGKDVLLLICPYCGAELDARNEFKLLRQFKDLCRPKTPLKIGMSGTLRKVTYTIIGILEYVQRDEWGKYPWVEFLLFSETHGYAWLCEENGHYVLGRDVKDAPQGRPMTFSGPQMPYPIRSHLNAKGKCFRVFEVAKASISFVEGELTWRASVQDSIKYLDAIKPPYIYCVEQGNHELEYFFGEYISPAEVFKAFGIATRPPKPEGVFSCQPFSSFSVQWAIWWSGIIFTFVSGALLYMVLVYGQGQWIFSQNIYLTPGQEVEIPFIAIRPDALLKVHVSAPLDNSWAEYDVTVEDEDDNEIMGFPLVASFYYGVEGGESWSEGSRGDSTYFKVPAAGAYRLVIAGEWGRDEWSESTGFSTTVSVKEGIKASRYLLITFLFMLGCAIVPPIWLERNRWADYYEDLFEEDDDD